MPPPSTQGGYGAPPQQQPMYAQQQPMHGAGVGVSGAPGYGGSPAASQPGYGAPPQPMQPMHSVQAGQFYAAQPQGFGGQPPQGQPPYVQPPQGQPAYVQPPQGQPAYGQPALMGYGAPATAPVSGAPAAPAPYGGYAAPPPQAQPLVQQQPVPQAIPAAVYQPPVSMPAPLLAPPPPGQAPAGAPVGPQYLFPPQYNAVIGVNGAGSYPPLSAPVPQYEPPVPYNHDFRAVDGCRAPQLVFVTGEATRSCEVLRMGCHTELNYSAAFVAVDVMFAVPPDATADQLKACTFQLPQNNNCAFTSCEFLSGPAGSDQTSWSVHEVSCLANSDAQELAAKSQKKGQAEPPKPVLDTDPSCFKMVVPGVAPGHQVVVRVTYYERVECFGGTYELRLPVGFGQGQMALEQLNQRCVATFAINSGVRNFESNGYAFPGTMGYELQGWSTSHQLWASQESPTRMTGMVVSSVPWPVAATPHGQQGSDIVLCYTTQSESIMGHVVTDIAPADATDQRGTFALFLCPPTSAPPSLCVNRRVVFVLDKSFSMDGAPLSAAKAAIKGGISMLRPGDFFAVVAFSSAQQIAVFPVSDEKAAAVSEGRVPFQRTGFLPCTSENKALACGGERGPGWIDSVVSDGGTDILVAMQTCKGVFDATRDEASAHGLMDTVFLLTDGAVPNERDVCMYVEKEMPSTRLLTFGVGGFVNTSFLRLLARVGRGFYEQSLNQACIADQMLHLMSKARAPLLTDITVQVEGEMYPRVLPDLYMGGPVTVVGKFVGPMPTAAGTVTVTGRLHGQPAPYTLTITPERNQHIPVHKLCVKTMLDDLTSDAWLHQSPELQQKVTDISCEENVPSAFTQQVAHKKVSEEDKKKTKGKKKGGAGKAALIVGGAVVAGAGVYLLARSGAFDGAGDVAATVANSPVVGAMGDGLAAAGHMLGEAGGAVLDFGASAGGVIADGAVTAGHAIAGGAETAGNAIADGATSAADSDCCSGIVQQCTDLGEQCVPACENLCQSLAGAVESVVPV